MALPWGAVLTEDDLATMPEDGHRYELLDGTLLVTPAPNVDHQRCVTGLLVLLHAGVIPSAPTLRIAPWK